MKVFGLIFKYMTLCLLCITLTSCGSILLEKALENELNATQDTTLNAAEDTSLNTANDKTTNNVQDTISKTTLDTASNVAPAPAAAINHSNNAGSASHKDCIDVTHGESVYICTSSKATKYHRTQYCRGLSRCNSQIQMMTQEQAENRGMTPCKICY